MGLPMARVDGRAWQTEHLWPRIGSLVLSAWPPPVEYGVEAVEVLVGGDCKTDDSLPEPGLLGTSVGLLPLLVLQGY